MPRNLALSQPRLVIAIDGPSGSGKSSVAKLVAQKLGLGYLDTGAMYRAVTWLALELGLDLGGQSTIDSAVAQADLVTELAQFYIPVPPLDPVRTDFVIDFSAGEFAAFLKDRLGPTALPEVFLTPESIHKEIHVDIATAIREPRIDDVVSLLATNMMARKLIVQRQRQIARLALDPLLEVKASLVGNLTSDFALVIERGVVIEGRDITSVIAPEAPIKVLLTASSQARQTRRAGQREAKEANLDPALKAAVSEHVVGRDDRDAAAGTAFLTPADPSVVVIDSTDLTLAQTVTRVLELVE